MEYKADVFECQFQIVKGFVYHFIYYRALSDAYRTSDLQSEFWKHTIDAHLLQAAICWCMVFGSHGNCNPTHWKKLSICESEELYNSFRQGLLAYAGITLQQWENYWQEMTYFRNNYAAHRALNYDRPIPKFSLSLKVAYFYDDWIRKVISPDIFEEPPLKKSARDLRNTIRPLINRFMVYTKQYNTDAEQGTAPRCV
jgi:hypothetical protein